MNLKKAVLYSHSQELPEYSGSSPGGGTDLTVTFILYIISNFESSHESHPRDMITIFHH